MKKLPVSIHTFRKIIEADNLYVDKTKDIYNLITNNVSNYYFLSRPRRFGKSLLISTLEEIFSGNKELFKDLWIYDKYDFKKYPVIRIDFSDIDLSTPEIFKNSLLNTIIRIAKSYNIELEESKTYKENFSELIRQLGKVEKVIVLIDEYDKPIVDFVDDLKTVEENKKILKNFYVTLKACEQFIKFSFLTGVSKFSKISVFSDLNNLTDITLDPNYSTMLGYTQSELEYYFDDRIKIMAEKLSVDSEYLKKELKNWYNGYSWDGKNFVYNPLSMLSVLKNYQINNYWFETGTPTFLVKLLKNKDIDIKSLENYTASKDFLDSFEIENIRVESLLFQTGYLTIKKIEQPDIFTRLYTLNYPNMEVKQSLLVNILSNFTASDRDDKIKIFQLSEALNKKDLDTFFNILSDMFAHIPHDIFIKDKEAYYHSIIYIILTLIGVRINVEVKTNKGQIDALIETRNNIYIMEFKLGSLKKAMNQIDKKEYFEGYQHKNKEIILIGVNFSIAKRNIKNWEIKNLKNE